MKILLSGVALAMALAGAAAAQPDAKGNAPLKPAHTVNDGAPKGGHNSFTEGQAREHIEKAGFSSVSNLIKGDDGVWRGHALRGGQATNVAMDFKGNVSTPPAPDPAPTPGQASAPAAAPAMRSRTVRTETTTRDTHDDTVAAHHAHRHRHRHGNCTSPTANGTACSGVDRNGNGISDREDRAIQKGAHP